MIWYDIVWHYMTWHYKTWHDMTWHDMIWNDMINQSTTWHDTTLSYMTEGQSSLGILPNPLMGSFEDTLSPQNAATVQDFVLTPARYENEKEEKIENKMRRRILFFFNWIWWDWRIGYYITFVERNLRNWKRND